MREKEGHSSNRVVAKNSKPLAGDLTSIIIIFFQQDCHDVIMDGLWVS